MVQRKEDYKLQRHKASKRYTKKLRHKDTKTQRSKGNEKVGKVVQVEQVTRKLSSLGGKGPLVG